MMPVAKITGNLGWGLDDVVDYGSDLLDKGSSVARDIGSSVLDRTRNWTIPGVDVRVGDIANGADNTFQILSPSTWSDGISNVYHDLFPTTSSDPSANTSSAKSSSSSNLLIFGGIGALAVALLMKGKK